MILNGHAAGDIHDGYGMFSALERGVDVLAGECILFSAVISGFHEVAGALVFFKDVFGQMPVAAAVFGGGAGADLFKFIPAAESIRKFVLSASAWSDDAEHFRDTADLLPVCSKAVIFFA